MTTRPKKTSGKSTESGNYRDSKEKEESELSTSLQSSTAISNAGHTDGRTKAQKKTQKLFKDKDNPAASMNGRDNGVSTKRESSEKGGTKNSNEEKLQQTKSGKDTTNPSLDAKAIDTTSKYYRRSKSVEQNGLGMSLGEGNIIRNLEEASCVSDRIQHFKANNGSRRRNGKIKEDEDTANAAKDSSGIRRQGSISNNMPISNLSKHLRDTVQILKLKKTDISNAAEKVNKVIDIIIKSGLIKSNPLFKSMKKMSTGSYYEGLKISNPNEFDIMLKISFESYQTIELTSIDESGAFYTLAFKNRRPPAMAPYVDDEGSILAKHILDEFRTLINNILQQSGKPASLEKKDPSSPAVTLSIPNEPENISVDLVLALEIRQWPEKASDGMNIGSWLGTKEKQKYRREPCYMVAKQANLGKKDKKDTWRVSFSNIEKSIINHHRRREHKRPKCCRKQCLKLMKYLLEQLKKSGNQRRMNKFCSYHAKTSLFHICANYPKDEDWKPEDLAVCFNRYVEFFQKCLKTYSLSNFFILSHNLFSADSIDKSSCNYLFEELENQKIENYPIFLSRTHQFESTPSLSLDNEGAQGYDY